MLWSKGSQELSSSLRRSSSRTRSSSGKLLSRRRSSRRYQHKRTSSPSSWVRPVFLLLFAVLVTATGLATQIQLTSRGLEQTVALVTRIAETLTGFELSGSHSYSSSDLELWLRTRSDALDRVWTQHCAKCQDDTPCVPYSNFEDFQAQQLDPEYQCLPFGVVRCCSRISRESRKVIIDGVLRHLQPLLQGGVSRTTMNTAKQLAEKDSDSVLVQVKSGAIHLSLTKGSIHRFHNLSTCSAMRNDVFQGHRLGRAYDMHTDGLGDHKPDSPRMRLGLRHLLLHLRSFIELREETPPDFEFVYSPQGSGVYTDIEPGNVSLFPSFAVLRREAKPTITFPLHDGSKGIDFGRWDDFRDKQRCALNMSSRVPSDEEIESMWRTKTPKAVFRGNFITRALSNGFSVTGKVDRNARITRENWKEMGRARLLALWSDHKDSLNIGYLDFPMSRRKKYGVGLEYLGDRPSQLGLDDQIRGFQIVLAAEGGDGWSEYLRYLLLSGSAVVKQQTPYTEWFQDMLTTDGSLLMADSNWNNLTKVIDHAIEQQNSTLEILTRSLRRTEDLTSVEGESLYAHLLFEGFSRLVGYTPRLSNDAVPISCKTTTGTCLWQNRWFTLAEIQQDT